MTLVEAVMSILIVALMLTAALSTIGVTARARYARSTLLDRQTLAMQLMAEIFQQRYVDPDSGIDRRLSALLDGPLLSDLSTNFGPETGEVTGDRSGFDDVDDYDGWSASPPENRDGTALPDRVGWTRSVSVRFATTTGLSASVSETRLKMITVTVTDPGGMSTSLSALRSFGGSFQYEPSREMTQLSSVGLQMNVGSERTTGIEHGATLLNQVTVNAGP